MGFQHTIDPEAPPDGEVSGALGPEEILGQALLASTVGLARADRLRVVARLYASLPGSRAKQLESPDLSRLAAWSALEVSDLAGAGGWQEMLYPLLERQASGAGLRSAERAVALRAGHDALAAGQEASELARAEREDEAWGRCWARAWAARSAGHASEASSDAGAERGAMSATRASAVAIAATDDRPRLLAFLRAVAEKARA